MRGFLIFLGLLLVLGGAVVAGIRFAPVDLAAIPALDGVPGARTFLTSQIALYAGGGAGALGFLLVVAGAVSGGRKKPAKAAAKAPRTEPPVAEARRTEPTAKAKPAPTASPAFEQAPAPAPAPAMAGPATAAAALAKPQASSQPPASALGQDPRLVNRKRVQDLVTINDALKAFHARYGAYPRVEGMGGAAERGPHWIPGLAPDFLKSLPCDPFASGSTQYVYASDGANYKLLARDVSLVGSANVEVLGIRIDRSREPTMQNAAFGFWTPDFASV